MPLNLYKIKSEVRSITHDNNIPSASIERWANLAQDDILKTIDADWLEETTTFPTVANQRRYLISGIELSRIKSVVDETSNRLLVNISEKAIDAVDPKHSFYGTPTNYCLYGLQTFKEQLPSAGTITVISSDGSDTSKYVLIRGTDSNGTNISEQLTLTGTTPVTGTKTFTTVTDITKSDTTTGYITVTSGITTLVRIPADKLSTQYQPIILYPIPSSILTIRLRYLRQARQMTNDYDEPDLPEIWHNLVLIGTLIQAHEYLYEFEKASDLQGKFNKQLTNLDENMGTIRDNRRKIKLPTTTKRRLHLGRIPDPIG